MGVLTNVEEARSMAPPGNTKSGHHPVITGLVVGLVVSLAQVVSTQWLNRNGSSDELVRLATEVTGMRKQLERIESRDFITRSEFERANSRLEDRLRDIERTFQSRAKGNDP